MCVHVLYIALVQTQISQLPRLMQRKKKNPAAALFRAPFPIIVRRCTHPSSVRMLVGAAALLFETSGVRTRIWWKKV